MLLRDLAFFIPCHWNTANQDTRKLLYMRRYCTFPSSACSIDCVGHCVSMAWQKKLCYALSCCAVEHLFFFLGIHAHMETLVCIEKIQGTRGILHNLYIMASCDIERYFTEGFFPHPGKGSNDTKTQRRSPWENETAERNIRPLKPTNKKRTTHNG